MIRKKIDMAASGDVIAAVAGKKIKVYALLVNVASDVTVDMKSATTSLTGVMSWAGKGGIVLDPLHEDHEPWFVTAPGEAFVFTLGSAVQVSGQVHYTVG